MLKTKNRGRGCTHREVQSQTSQKEIEASTANWSFTVGDPKLRSSVSATPRQLSIRIPNENRPTRKWPQED